MKFLVIFIVAAGTAILVRVFEIIIRAIIGNRQRLKFVTRFFPVFELLIGLALIFWAVDFLFSGKSYYFILVVSLIAVVVALISWYIFRDVLAGVVFRVQNNLPRGASIQLGNISGRMLQLRSSHIVIETEEGRTIRIPYSQATNEIISEQQEKGVHEDSTIKLRIPNKTNWSQLEIQLKNTLMNTPWRLIRSEPVVHLISEEKNFFQVEIHLKTHSKKHENNICQFLQNKFGGESF